MEASSLMEIRAAIVDPLPLYRHGVAAALREVGFTVDRPADIWRWLTDASRQIVLLSLGVPADWRLLADLHASRPDIHVLALVSDSTPETYARALAAGAVSVVPRAGSAEELREAFSALVKGKSLLPVAAIGQLAGGRSEPPTGHTSDDLHGADTLAQAPSPRERDWLRHLATGVTVAELARTAGYSERMMFRLLRSLYGRMAASNRTEALMRARDHGWI